MEIDIPIPFVETKYPQIKTDSDSCIPSALEINMHYVSCCIFSSLHIRNIVGSGHSFHAFGLRLHVSSFFIMFFLVFRGRHGT